ncbi:portal protein [bacterium]|nr:portal protein [bacterium]
MADKNKKNTRNPQSVLFRRLTKLLSGPLTQYRTQNNHKLRRIDLDKYATRFKSASGRDFKKTAYNPYDNLQANVMASQARTERYVDFDQMEYTPEIASSLDIYADEMTTHSSLSPMMKVVCENEEIKAILESLYINVLNIEHNLFSWCRTMCKYGDFFLYLDMDDTLGITSVIGLPTGEMERMEGEDKTNPNYVQFQWNSAGLTLENWQVGHFRILGQDKYNPYGTSVLEPARRIWRQLTLLEDAMMAYRIVRSPERRAFYIDVGNIPPQDVEQYMQKIMTQMKRNQVVDPSTGRVDLRYNPLSIEEDYFIPVRGQSATKIEPVAGGKYTGDIDDVKYLRDKLFSALKVPASYISSDGENNQEDKTTLAQKDVRFARTIQRLQRSVLSEIEKIGIIHLYTLGYREEDLVSFRCTLNNPSKIAEMQELEHWKTKFDIVGAATEGFFSKQWLASKMFGLSDEEFIRNRREMFYDKKYEAALETAAEAEQAEATAGLNAGADDMGELGGDLGEPGGTGVVGAEPELGAPEPDPATTDAPGGDEDGGLLAEPPGKREDDKGRTTTEKSHGWYEPRSLFASGDRRKSSGPRKKNMNRAASPEFGSARKTLPGSKELSQLARGTGVYSESQTNYKKEELKILKEEKELEILFKSLKARKEKNETEA